MPRIPTYRKQKTPSGRVGAVPLDISKAYVQGSAVGEGMASAGAGLSNLGGSLAKIVGANQSALDQTAAANTKSIMKEADLEYEQFKVDNPDPKTWAEGRDSINKRAAEKAGLESWGTKRGQQLATSGMTKWGNLSKDIATLDITKRNLAIAAEATKNQYIQDPTPENLKEYKQAVEAIIPPEFVDDTVKELERAGTIKQIQDEIVLDPEGAKADLEAELESRKGKEPKDAVLSNTDISDLISDARREKSQLETRDAKLLNESAAEVEPGWNEKWANGTLSKAEILAWKPALTDPDAIRKHVDIQQEWINKIGKKDGKGPGYTEVIRGIDLETDRWNPTKIWAQVPSKITGEQAPMLVKHWESKQSGTNSNATAFHTRFQSTLTSEEIAGFYGRKGKKKTENKVNDISQKLTKFKTENPDATFDQWKQYYNDITQGEKSSGGLIRRLLVNTLKVSSGIVRLQTDPFSAVSLKGLKPEPGVNIPELGMFNEGDSQVDKDGVTWVLVKKGKTPAEDEWLEQ